MDVRLALVVLCFILAGVIQSSDCGKRNRIVIHVPYKIKNVKHMHTVYKTIHIMKHPEKPEPHEETPEHAEIEAEAEEHEHEHFHHQHIHKVDKHGHVISPSKQP